MSQEKLLEAFNELNYEHQIFRRRVDELLSILDRDPAAASTDFLSFFERAVAPHFSREEEIAFPAILNIKPEEERLIAQLKEEHKALHGLFNRVKEGSVGLAKERIEEFCVMVGRHAEKEGPLYQMILKELLKGREEK
jgi:iron-sulfur cluster repair protein YtfE (RIC family)